jgi:hypothetical protein
MSNGTPRPSSQDTFEKLCTAKGEIARLIAADLGYLGIPRYEHIHAASLMVEARMLASERNPPFQKTDTPLEQALQKYLELDLEYSAVTALPD